MFLWPLIVDLIIDKRIMLVVSTAAEIEKVDGPSCWSWSQRAKRI
jgi:hypothetical protein